MFLISLSSKYPEQYVVTTEDPYALYSLGIKVTDDGTLVESNKIMQICQDLSKIGRVDFTIDAQAQFLSDHKVDDILLPSFTSSKIPKMFQRRGFYKSGNKPSFVYAWNTGTGKSLAGTLEICRALDNNFADIAIVVPSVSLAPQWEEMLKSDTSLDVASVHRCSNKEKRMCFYCEQHDVYIINYDKFAIADDLKAIERMCKNRRVILVMDETHKIKHRTTNNKSMKKFCNHVKPVKIVGLTATPIEASLLDWYNQMRVFNSEIYGTVKDFEFNYTVGHGQKDIFGRYIGFCNFEDCRLKTAHMVSFADKNTDSAIAAEFPEKNEIIIPIELSHFERRLYDEIVSYGKSLGDERNGALFMQYLQRLCNAPETLIDSQSDSSQGRCMLEIASKYSTHLRESKESSKMKRLESLIEELMECQGKTVVFAHYTNLCLVQLARRLSKWSPLVYHGSMTNSEKEKIISEFKSSLSRRLLLLSDAAAEGLNLPQANSLIHYDTPAQYSKYMQRSDRISRIDSAYSTIDVYRFMTRNTIEERIEALMAQRRELAQNMGFMSDMDEAMMRIDIDEMSGGYDYLLGF